MQKLTIKIELKYGNAEMQTAEQAEQAITEGLSKLYFDTDDYVGLRDLNGNKVGFIDSTLKN